MTDTDLYRQHLETLDGYLREALLRTERDGLSLEGVVFHAGVERTYHADDEHIPFHSTGHFRRWVPLEGPDHVVVARPGQKPLVIEVRPKDYWYDPSPAPASYWQQAVELREVERFDQIPGITGSLRAMAYVGESAAAAEALEILPSLVEPQALMNLLDWFRAYKTEHEIALISAAAEAAAAGHRAARDAFLGGASEREIHWRYLEGAGALEREMPFPPISALDEKCGILHYQHKRGSEAAPGKVLLMDAGAQCDGYASDITRTWAADGADELFVELLRGVDALQRELVAQVVPGKSFVELHLDTHVRIAELLQQTGILRVPPYHSLDRGITSAFLPHGLGHHLGTQVHDVGGHQATPEGGTIAPPDAHPFLRNTRELEPGHVVTIEPGIYFIPMLLEPLRQGPDAFSVDWKLVDRLLPCGGIRIEDDVLCTGSGPRDLTRELIEGP
jgi:Xaa-Pro dipeptidase